MCLQIGPEQFEYLYCWESDCNTVPQSLLNPAKLLSFEGFLMESHLGPRLPGHASPKDFHNGKCGTADLALAGGISKGRRSVGGPQDPQGRLDAPHTCWSQAGKTRDDDSMVPMHAHVHACPLQAHLLVTWVKAGACVQTSDKCHLCMGVRMDLDHPFSTLYNC